MLQFANNVAKFILSIGPQTTKEKGIFKIDLTDDAVQNMLISFNGEARWGHIIPFAPPAPPAKPVKEEEHLTPEQLIERANEKQKSDFIRNTGLASLAAAVLLAFGATSDSMDSVSLLATFALAGLAGYQVVWGVAPGRNWITVIEHFGISQKASSFCFSRHRSLA